MTNDEIRKLLQDNPAKPYLSRILWVDRNLRRVSIVLWDCSVSEIRLTDRIAILTPNHRQWWWPPVCGAVFLY
jgi:hypothetical protein